MACDGCALYTMLTNRLNVFHLLIVASLAFAILHGSATVAAKSDLSYYNYDVSTGKLSLDETAHSFRGIESDDDALTRRRRWVGTEKSQFPETETDQPVVKTEMSPTSVKYSTDKLISFPNATMKTTVPQTDEKLSTATTVNLETPEPKTTTKNPAVVVSNPMNPTNDQSIHFWGNQTHWDNTTEHSEKKMEAPASTDTVDVKNENGADEKMENTTSEKNVTTQSTTNSSDSELGDISITKFSDVTNNTLARNNITKTEEDTHRYYNSTFFSDENVAKTYWVNIDKHPYRQVNDLLSKSHRRAATVKLKFDFPFYGHKVRNITIATGGFLYTGEYVHSWLAATQYIAPLMANFDTRLSNDSWVKYADNGTAFTVEWERVVLQDRPEAGGFTFQATLHDNGNIVFVYHQIPLTVEAIEDTAHPVKVGLSDAYIMDRTIFFVRRKTIYEYHRVNFNHQEIKTGTVIYLRALPTCLEMNNCSDCLTKVPGFDCKWCPDLRRCSTGTFRFRQDWLEKGCEHRNIKERNSCPEPRTTYGDNSSDGEHPEHARGDVPLSASIDRSSKGGDNSAEVSDSRTLEHGASHMNMGVSGIIGILLAVSLITGLAGWAGYAYRNPHSASGQMLIRYRPSQWSWRRGEARYTAATIHM